MAFKLGELVTIVDFATDVVCGQSTIASIGKRKIKLEDGSEWRATDGTRWGTTFADRIRSPEPKDEVGVTRVRLLEHVRGGTRWGALSLDELRDVVSILDRAAGRKAPPTPQEQLETLRAGIEKLEARERAIYRASLEAPDDQKVCDDAMTRMLGEESQWPRFTWPIEVHGVTYTGDIIEKAMFSRATPGTWVAVRPCDKELGGKTFLGVFLGNVALSTGVRFHRETGVLEVYRGMHNPAMWVPDLKRIVFGAGSWWGILKGPDDLRKITDADIQNVWYVQALKALSEQAPATTSEGA